MEKVNEIQEYLKKRGITVAETTIVNAAIDIATRWGGKGETWGYCVRSSTLPRGIKW